MGECLAVEEDGFHVAVLWVVVPDDTESSCGSGFSRELLPWLPPLPSQGREPGLATDSVSSVMTSAHLAAVAPRRPRSPRTTPPPARPAPQPQLGTPP